MRIVLMSNIPVPGSDEPSRVVLYDRGEGVEGRWMIRWRTTATGYRHHRHYFYQRNDAVAFYANLRDAESKVRQDRLTA